MSDIDIHKGHRGRIIERFLSSPQSFSEHELLEIMLFPVIPRKDTNALAHRILRVFGSLSGVFGASAAELTAVDGVGERVAAHIAVTGEIFRIMKERESKENKPQRFSSFGESKKILKEYFGGLEEERLIILLLDGKRKKLTCLIYGDQSVSGVEGDAPELAKAVALYKPRFALIAHNHPSGVVLPSEEDDFATKKINAILSMHGVMLTDHIIISGEDAFSYHAAGRMEYIKECSDSQNIFRNIKE